MKFYVELLGRARIFKHLRRKPSWGAVMPSPWRVLILLVAATAALGTGPASAQSDVEAQANNPLADMRALAFQNYYVGDLTGSDTDANQFILRYAQPFSAFGGNWLMRASLPVNTVPTNDGHASGLGDLNILAAYLFDTGNPDISFGFGPQFTLPTSTSDETGSRKWSLGAANVLFNASSKKVQWGYLLTWQHSVAGSSDQPEVNVGAFQPFVFYQLGEGWYLRSSGIWTYNFESSSYAMPVGFGLGKTIKFDDIVANIFVEPQYSIATGGKNQQEWNIYGGINFQFKSKN